jgi:transcriptional regulator with XRE-family HTH domain
MQLFKAYTVSMDAQELIRRREALGLSRRAFAKEVGVDHVTVWRWETESRRRIPATDQMLERTLKRLERRRATPPTSGEGEGK